MLLAMGSQSGAQQACPFDLKRGAGWVVFSGDYMLAFQAEQGRIEVGETFALLVNVCTRNDKGAELVAVTAEADPRHAMVSARSPGSGWARTGGTASRGCCSLSPASGRSTSTCVPAAPSSG